MIITFRAYSKDQIIKILCQRLTTLPYTAFQPQALELCARRVAAASGDMRKALWVCRSAIEILEAEIKESLSISQSSSLEQACFDNQKAAICNGPTKKEFSIVRVDHVAAALSKAYKSPVVDTIQSLPQHQQLILCSAVKLFRGKKKDSTVGELNKFYADVCKSTLIPPVGTVELSSMCRVLADQGLIKLGQSREDKLKRVDANAYLCLYTKVYLASREDDGKQCCQMLSSPQEIITELAEVAVSFVMFFLVFGTSRRSRPRKQLAQQYCSSNSSCKLARMMQALKSVLFSIDKGIIFHLFVPYQLSNMLNLGVSFTTQKGSHIGPHGIIVVDRRVSLRSGHSMQ
ncbi:replication origin binding protein [Lithospermum erythrorhizon]|uniref:Replication origin binding protein n=1 Tax=Lithospermum erythrorhizon TaxID=34254 RepID=A0AAV3R9F8_LITER